MLSKRIIACLDVRDGAAVQCHPEKSSDAGLRILRNLLRRAPG